MMRAAFQPGFRLSTIDIVILIVGGVLAAGAVTVDRSLALAIAFVVVHFFLFCNVLRMSRALELIWSGVFVVLALATIALQFISWPTAFALSSTVTVIVALIETRRPSYHGVGWQTINPRLPEWWRITARVP